MAIDKSAFEHDQVRSMNLSDAPSKNIEFKNIHSAAQKLKIIQDVPVKLSLKEKDSNYIQESSPPSLQPSKEKRKLISELCFASGIAAGCLINSLKKKNSELS